MKKGLKNFFAKALFLGLLISGFAGCGQQPSVPTGPQKGDANWVDYVYNGSVKLNLDYKDKDFYVDGVGQFTLKTAIDGDTAHFTPLIDSKGKGTMKARFFGIDTPESTGKVQEYGKPASKFTKAILEEANEKGTIVVSSAQTSYGKPNPDSTGSRYVSLVWVNLEKKNASMDELVLLNLWIVQEGLSWVKNVQDMAQYSDTFYAAETQAREYKLKLFSGEPDPDFNYGDYEDVSLLEIKEELALTLADSTHENKYDNARIRIQGTVAGYSNHILYLQDYVLRDKDDPNSGEYCGINIFVGMSPIASKYQKLNTFIQVCGLAQYTENYGFQVTDTQGRFPYGSPTSENDAKIIYTPDQNKETEHNLTTVDYTVSQMNAIAKAKDPYNLECLNCNVKITENLVCESAYVNSSSDKEITVYFKNCDFACYIPFNYYGDLTKMTQRWVKEDDFKGKTFTLTGVYVLHKTVSGKINFQIVPSSNTDLLWVRDA